MEISKQNIRIQRWVLIVALLVFAVKIAAWFFTNSLAVLTDALESIVNVLGGALGLYSLFISAKPRDEGHPYGHGKAEYLSSAAEGVFILLAGLYIIYQAIRSFFVPHEIGELTIGIGLMAFTAAINFAVGIICERAGRRNRSLQLVAAAKHLKMDTISTVALMVGLAVIHITGVAFLDGVIALIASIIIIVTGTRVLRASIAGMMDEADEELLAKAVAILNEKRNENWIDLHNMRIIKYGQTLHCDCHLTVPWYLNVREGHREITLLADTIKNELGASVECFVHTDPCVPASCRICVKKHCAVRKHPLEKRITWTVGNVVQDSKHRL